MRKLIGLPIVLAVVLMVVVPGLAVDSSASENVYAPEVSTAPILTTFNVKVESAAVDKTLNPSSLPPRAPIATKVEVENTGMLGKKDALLRVVLQDGSGKVVYESSLLVYVAHGQSKTFTVSTLARSAGTYHIVAEVAFQGRAVAADPVDVGVSALDLFI